MDRKGQALVEFALVFPVMMLILLALFDVGRLVFAYNDITNAARSGARVAIVNQGSNVARDATVNQATSLDLQTSDVSVAYLDHHAGGPCSTGGAPLEVGCLVRIQVTFDWTAITPVVGNVLGPITVTTETTMPIERVYP